MLRILPKLLYFQTLFRITRISQAKMLLPPLPQWIKLERVTRGGIRGSVYVVFAVNRLCRATPATSPRIFNVKEFLSDFLPCYAKDHVHFISCWFARCSLGEVNNGFYPIPIPAYRVYPHRDLLLIYPLIKAHRDAT